MERRKTTSAAVRQFAITDEQLAAWAQEGNQQQSMADAWQQQPPKHASRPMSWHPGSSQVYSSPVAMLAAQSYASPSFHCNEQSLSPPCQMLPIEYQTFAALSSYSQPQPTSHPVYTESQQNFNNYQSYSQMMAPVSTTTSTATMSYPIYASQQPPISTYQEQEFVPAPQSQVHTNMHQEAAYSTSATSPIQDIPAQTIGNNNSNSNSNSIVPEPALVPEPEDDSEELVGMGLYDLPDNTSWLLTGQSTGKGLKLEEPWQPPPEEEDDDEEDAEEEEDNEQAMEAEPEPEPELDTSSAEESDSEPLATVSNGWSSMSMHMPTPMSMPMQTQIAPTPAVSTDLSGHSFFFEDEDSAANKDWWYEATKQPLSSMMAPQQAGLGYGWIYSS